MKKILNDFVLQNEAILEFLETTGRNYKEADYVIPQFNDFMVRSKFNVAMALDYLITLQHSNDGDITDSYSLEDITGLYNSLLKIQEYNLDAYVDAAHFQFSVMNNNTEARRIAEEGINNANQKIEELQKLLHLVSKSRNP